MLPFFGSVVDGRSWRGDLRAVDTAFVWKALRTNGVVLFRNFSGGVAEFEDFTKLYCPTFVRHQNKLRDRLPGDGNTGLVSPGQR